ncbi:succinate dehydrogenase subunit C [Humitalea rosea]|uniref:Succinate dehydrogenase cytochrome b556 subunit n=1 Tax=Humitalea rosea TaxID=990373 RepID=A0A2W7ILG3_9PROT|nr:succinate dehydrogenase, cytochrome b556 subunit [Humitalea rosea]PZW46541.1 succinate dehydrogenase subunit C [Humitalea rosea]
MSLTHDAREAAFHGRRTDGSKVRRPLSPHLQVYKPQWTSGLSILNRIAGIGWTAGLLLLVWWLVAAAAGAAAFEKAQWFLGSFIGLLMLFGLTLAAWFHTLAGIRHLVWDAGFGFALPRAYASGMVVVIGTGVLTVLTWVIALVIW